MSTQLTDGLCSICSYGFRLRLVVSKCSLERLSKQPLATLMLFQPRLIDTAPNCKQYTSYLNRKRVFMLWAASFVDGRSILYDVVTFDQKAVFFFHDTLMV